MSRAPFVLPLLLMTLLLPACGGGGGGASGGGPAALGEPPTATLMVTNHDNDGPGSLRQAVADAPPGAWIVFDPALAPGDINLGSPIEVTKVLTIGGLAGGGARHGIDGGGFFRIFEVISGALQLNDLVLQDGNAGSGAAVHGLFSHIVLVRCHVRDCNSTGRGGALYLEGGSLAVRDSFFQDNYADTGGGAIATLECPSRIERTSFAGNESLGSGGAIWYSEGRTVATNCSFHHNHSLAVSGGAICALEEAGGAETVLEVYNATITENTAANEGGGICVGAVGGQQIEFIMHRSIVAMNTGGVAPDTYKEGTVNAAGTYNMIGVGGGMFFHGIGNSQVGDAVTPFDPEVIAAGPLPDGRIAALPLPAGVAVDAVPAGTNVNADGEPMIVDMRFLPRFPAQPSDIGAIEL